MLTSNEAIKNCRSFLEMLSIKGIKKKNGRFVLTKRTIVLRTVKHIRWYHRENERDTVNQLVPFLQHLMGL